MAVPKTTSETLKHKINPSAGETAPRAIDVLLYTPLMGQERVSFLFGGYEDGRSNSMHDDRNNLVRRETKWSGGKELLQLHPQTRDNI